jgi:hypothetical protein
MTDQQLLDAIKAKRDKCLLKAIRAYKIGQPKRVEEMVMRAELYWTLIAQLDHLLTSEEEEH